MKKPYVSYLANFSSETVAAPVPGNGSDSLSVCNKRREQGCNNVNAEPPLIKRVFHHCDSFSRCPKAGVRPSCAECVPLISNFERPITEHKSRCNRSRCFSKVRGFGSDEMVEVLATSFQNMYNKYARLENVDNFPKDDKREIYITPVNTQQGTVEYDDPQIQTQFRNRLKSRKTFYFNTKQLCEVKSTKWDILSLKKQRPLVGQCCSVCIPYAVRKNMRFESTLKNLLDIYNIGPSIKTSMFGRNVDTLMFFNRQKSHQYKYIYNEGFLKKCEKPGKKKNTF
ncbi:Hypothetical protein CINCED_3A025108 [Cinara cedri]|uniref:Uncharacterized protein n=1 Tax=Cinara cedri TaxID=506608 RepID=A0A5E4MSE4_9HEMI|nr:Hypothetical protein CINCED_3A025108 [Cinara cedri]